jgi:carboxypeptidase T
MNYRIVWIFFSLLFLAAISSAGDVAHHTLIRLKPSTEAQAEQLRSFSQLDFVAGEHRGDLCAAALPQDLQSLQNSGIPYEVLIMDMEDYFARRARREGSLDDMGGYKTYSEIETALDVIHANHPSITTAKFNIGNSLEGNPIWCMKISDNPEVDEDEIELLYNSLAHCREPAAMEALFVFFDYLTNNYSIGSGNEATNLVDNREFYWIPCVNPDGYLYNEQEFPDGGGMWRKNRRNNGDGSYGIDLNRNFGFNWGYDNSGSSPDPSSDLYRGTGPFSEPETDALRDFIESREFLVAMNYHTYSNYILYPWGTESFQSGHTPEDEIFSLMADSMAYYIEEVNGVLYETGTAWEVLYSVNGDANDWGYGEQVTKQKIYSMTTEVGSFDDNFWPLPSRIMPLALENLPSNLFVARYAEQLVPPDQAIELIDPVFSEAPGDGDGILESGESVVLDFSIRNIGGLELTGLSGHLISLSPFVTVTNSPVGLPDAARGVTVGVLSPLEMNIAPGVPEPFGIEFSLHITAASGLDTTISLSVIIGPPVLAEDFESGATGWTHAAAPGGWQDQWHISTERFHGGTHSYKCGDPGTGYYVQHMDALLTSPLIVDLPESAMLRFWSNIDAQRSSLYPDSAYDGGMIEISADGGPFTLIAPVSGYTHTFRWRESSISLYTGPVPGAPCLSGTYTWREYEVDLAAFAGQDLQVRFRFGSDNGGQREGWYIDDVIVTGIRDVMVVPPTGLTIQVVGDDILLYWDDDINLAYRIYSSSNPETGFETFIGSTTDTLFTIVDGINQGEEMFYIVKGALSEE